MVRFVVLLLGLSVAGCSSSGLCHPPSGYTPEPDHACTSQNVGEQVCPGGPGSGSGYECTPQLCWSEFADGPCAGAWHPDGG